MNTEFKSKLLVFNHQLRIRIAFRKLLFLGVMIAAGLISRRKQFRSQPNALECTIAFAALCTIFGYVSISQS